MTKVAAIETKGLCIGYLLKGGKRKVVHEDLNLQLVSGEVTCLLGLNSLSEERKPSAAYRPSAWDGVSHGALALYRV